MRARARLGISGIHFGVLALAAVAIASAAQAQTTINNQTVTVPPTAITPGDDLFVGTTGTGTLNIVTGGTVTTAETTLGQATTGNGTVNVTGGTFDATGDVYVGLAGTGTLTISAGGIVTTTSGASVGDAAGSTGTVTLTGAGSTWTDSSSVTIGAQGNGSMTVSAGAVFNTGNVYVGSSEGSSGTFTLTGAGSELNLTSSLYIADDGTGTFNVTDGATLTVSDGIYVSYTEGQGVFNVSGGSTVTSGEATFGYYSDNGKGTANISGAGTTWTIDGDLTLGDEGGAGELNILDGAVVTVTGALEMGVYDEEITRGDLLITGGGSQLNIVGDAYIGYERPAIVVVSNGGLLQIDGTTYISSDDTAPSTVTVTGTGSQFIADDIYISDSSGADGTLTVTNGARADTGDVYIGNATGSTATLNVSGATTVWEGSPTFYVGYEGTGVMNITDGMKFDSTNPVSYFYLGYNDASAVGTVNISGAGTEVFVDNYVNVGGLGAGVFNVTGGAVVTTDYLYGADGPGGGEMLVSGAGSSFNADYGAYIGYSSGTFNVVVTDGGLLSTTSTSLQIGYGNGTTGVVEVSNGGQVWSGQGIIVGGQGDGTLTLSTGASATANFVTIAAQAGSDGTLIFGAAASEPAVAAGTLSAPTVAFGSGSGEIVFNHTSNLTFAPAVGGSGAISVLSGTTTFATDSATFTGDVTVTGGTAVFNALLPGDVTVSGSGIVGGSGTIASLDVQSGGTVAPGNSPGTLNVTGNVAFASGSNYAVEVAGAVSDLISASGSATLSGGTVQVSGAPALMRYTILTAVSGVAGTFDSVDTTSAFIRYSLDYDPDNVYLVIDGFNSLTIAARTPNQYAVARALDQFPTSNPLYSAVIGQNSIAGAQQALNALSGEIHASVGTALADDNRYVREAITGRLIQAYYSGGAGAGQPIVLAATAPTDVAIVDPSTRMSLGAGYGAATAPHGSHNLAYWSRAFGAWGQYDSNGNAATTDRDLGGFITGVDGALGGGWRAGLATGYTYTGLDADARASSASINSYVLGGYAGGAVGDVALRSGGTWTWHDIDTSRAVIFPGFFESESANYNGDTGQLFAELAYPIFTHGGLVEPFAGLAYVHVGTDGFTESGPIAALTSAGSDTNVGYGTLGARVGSTMVWGGTTLIPHASLAWQYAFGDVTPLRTLAFASTGIGMGIGGVPLAQNSALLDIGADVLVGPDATLGLSYMGQYAGDVQDNGLRGRFNWRY